MKNLALAALAAIALGSAAHAAPAKPADFKCCPANIVMGGTSVAVDMNKCKQNANPNPNATCSPNEKMFIKGKDGKYTLKK
jgi:opacity protein-like surface antigen